jgi:hypothetical protein
MSLSCLVLSCLVLSCLVLSCLVILLYYWNRSCFKTCIHNIFIIPSDIILTHFLFPLIHTHTFTITTSLLFTILLSSSSYYIIAKRGITDERAALQEALMTWQTDGLASGSQKFASGSADPNLSDLAVYGTLRSVEGLPAFRRIMEDPDNVALAEWYLRVKDRVC